MDSPVQQFYQNKKESFIRTEHQLVKKTGRISAYRLLVFILIPFSLIWLSRYGLLAGLVPGIIFTAVFLYLIKIYIVSEKERKRYSVLVKIAEDELSALNHEFLQFEPGKTFLNPEHPYSYDLDLFGEGSLFQFLNRTSTISGRKVLVGWLLDPPLDKDTIVARQEAVSEIASKRDWRLNFLASGKLFDESDLQHDEVVDWSKKELPFPTYQLVGVLRKIIPALTLLAIIPAVVFGITIPLLICVFAQWAFQYFYRKRTKEYYRYFDQKSQLIEKYVSLLKEIEKENFSASWLVQNHKRITTPESAGRIIGRLGKLVREFEFRQNLLVAFILNSLFLWDLRCIYLLREWHEQNRDNLAAWLEVIENTDALISLANFADNHPDFTFPEIVNGEFTIEAKNLGHPLLDPKKRVNSDFSINGWSKSVIVTGANMAGKSTFLRAVGVNMVLARIGAPVCASGFVFTPVDLFTNMRTTDSLFHDESYFFAELKRLSTILNQIREGQGLFVILDEMLKGTNSVDKLTGSKELIRKFIQLNSVALIATHDLKLSEMEQECPGQVFNKCFEITILDDELVFDYKLTNGVTKTMNATFLMKKMGII